MLYRRRSRVQVRHLFKRARFSPETIGDPDMGVAAEYVAERYNITREMQDEYACLSYKRTLQALEKAIYMMKYFLLMDY